MLLPLNLPKRVLTYRPNTQRGNTQVEFQQKANFLQFFSYSNFVPNYSLYM